MRLPAEARDARAGARRRAPLAARESGVSDDDAAEILVACGEACANVVQHAYSGDPAPGPLEVEAHVAGGALEMQRA